MCIKTEYISKSYVLHPDIIDINEHYKSFKHNNQTKEQEGVYNLLEKLSKYAFSISNSSYISGKYEDPEVNWLRQLERQMTYFFYLPTLSELKQANDILNKLDF
jgi:hypothetical protein